VAVGLEMQRRCVAAGRSCSSSAGCGGVPNTQEGSFSQPSDSVVGFMSSGTVSVRRFVKM